MSRFGLTLEALPAWHDANLQQMIATRRLSKSPACPMEEEAEEDSECAKDAAVTTGRSGRLARQRPRL